MWSRRLRDGSETCSVVSSANRTSKYEGVENLKHRRGRSVNQLAILAAIAIEPLTARPLATLILFFVCN